ncbi:thioester reductase domain-containing protein [Leptolyngbya sp. GB1-A1]|uniref:thioester reductase domain-containing protein n=1 Tax=Leptolyngbya sp. GB1-A1 TaxID=2933908 RepID=UPI003296C02D
MSSQKNESQFSTLVELLRHRALTQPRQCAFAFLQEGEEETGRLTYQELDALAQAIATQLQNCSQFGDRALLIYPSGLEFIAAFFGCLYAGIIAVPANPPRPNRSINRLNTIIADAGATIVLTTGTIFSGIEQRFEDAPDLASMRWITTDEISPERTGKAKIETWQVPAVQPDTLAFLQYTSGSTGNPKGVMVSHHNLLHNLAYMKQAFGITDEGISVTWLPNFHDMGLIEGLLQPIYSGILGILMPPTAFLQKPIRWLQTISRYRATHSGAPNFAYELCTHKITEDQKRSLDLSSWTNAYCGAEPIRRSTIDQFIAAFEPCGFRAEYFYPCYGMAEATLMISGGLVHEKPIYCNAEIAALEQNRVIEAGIEQPSRTIVGCGRTWLDAEIAIAHPEHLTSCPENEIGEIWVSGASVAQGYWQNPQATEETFHAYLKDTGAGPFLRTGDLGFLRNGELYVTGRLKDVVIVRGRNHYPQDIETTVEKSHPSIRPSCSAAFSVEVEGEERLVVVAEVERRYRIRRQKQQPVSVDCRQQDRRQVEVDPGNDPATRQPLDTEEVFWQIRQSVAEHHELQVYAILLLQTGSILKTSSGKIQRRACRASFLAETLEAIAESRLSIPHMASINSAAPAQLNPPSDDPTQAKADELVHWLRDYNATRINSQLIDERRSIPPYIVLDFGNQGLLGMQVPESYGGIALSHCSTLRIFEQIGAIDQTLALFTALNNVLGIRPILHYGSKALKAELLPMLAAGRELGAFAITEPGAGSNPQAIAAQAIPVGGDHWHLYGTKIWSGSAAWAGVLNVFVKQQNDQGKTIGMSAFTLRQNVPGLRQGPEALTMGMRGMVQNTVFLEGVPVEAGQLLGTAGAGMTVAQDAMMYGRLSIAANCIGGMKRCAQLMMRYADRRTISSGRLLENSVTLMRLNDLTAAIAATEALVSTIAERLDTGMTVPVEAYTVCKTAATEFFWQATDQLVQILGGRGYIETNIAPQLLRDARILRILEGPTEALNYFLGSRVMNQLTDLLQFLREFQGDDIAEQLQLAAEQIHHRYQSRSNLDDRMTKAQWASGLVGELTTWAVLWSVSRWRSLSNPKFSRAATWAQLQFEKKLAETNNPAEAVFLSVDLITQLTAEYSSAIGDTEQMMAGENRDRDPLLQKEMNPPAIHPVSQPERLLDEPKPQASETMASIQAWIQRWIGERLGFRAEAVLPEESPLNYGLDSVTVQEFIQAMENELSLPAILDSSLLWQIPTIAALAEYLATEVQNSAPGTSSLDLQAEAALDPSIQPAIWAINSILTDVAHPKAIFLTGATGFLGAFLLNDLLQQTQAQIYCLVRASNPEQGKARIIKNLEGYGIWHGQYSDRIVPILGDLEKPYFGWTEDQFIAYADLFDSIYHSAAYLNFVYAYSELKASNVLGTQEVLRLASRGQVKPVHYVSTVAAYESLIYAGKVVTETDRPKHSESIFMGYSQSKWVAEQLVLAARDRGIPVNIYRSPLISGHSRRGSWYTDDFMCRIFKGCIQMGSAPDLELLLDLSPVDYVSGAIAHLSLQSTQLNQTFHLMNPQSLPWNDLFDWMRSFGYSLQRLSYRNWQAEIKQLTLCQNNPLYPLRPFFLKPWSEHSLTILELYQQSFKPDFNCQQTLQALAESDISCPVLSDSLLQTYFNYFIDRGFLEVPVSRRKLTGLSIPTSSLLQK